MAGRPTTYQSSYPDVAAKLCKLGAKDADLADFFGIGISTLSLWKHVHPELLASIKTAKKEADTRVERSLYERATGYSFDAVKIFVDKGKPLIVPYREHVPPDAASMIFWLKNRQPQKWRDKHDYVHTGKDGAPLVPTINVTIGSVEPPPSSETG